jgi:hypothetical protein
MKALIKAHFTTNENIMIKLHIKVVIHRYCHESGNQTIDEDEAAVTAMSIHRSLRFAMSLGKKTYLKRSNYDCTIKTVHAHCRKMSNSCILFLMIFFSFRQCDLAL